jgi:predicted acetyltransferase
VTTEELELRTAQPDDLSRLVGLITGAFLRDTEDDELDVHRLVFEPDRAHVVSDGGEFVATGAVLTRDMTVPGATIPVAHVTAVAVRATHRRQGLLTRIMRTQLQAIKDGGSEPVAALWASEGAIYGRFGYGLASWQVHYDIATRETALPPATVEAGRLRQAVPRDVIDRLAKVYDDVRVIRPGMSSRDDRWWRFLTADPESWRRDTSTQRAVLYEEGDELHGYALWRVKPDWGLTVPSGEVSVTEVVASSVDAYAALWRFLLSIDLTRSVKYNFAGLDEPLPHLLTNPKAVGTSVMPGLWIRVVDLPAALKARRYAVPIDVVLEVSDALLPDNAGRWHLIGDGATAQCERTDATPDLQLDVRQVGAVFLGGTSMLSLAEAGLVVELRQGSLAVASAAFGWKRAPLSVEIF